MCGRRFAQCAAGRTAVFEVPCGMHMYRLSACGRSALSGAVGCTAVLRRVTRKASVQNASHIFERIVSRFDEDFPVAADIRDAEFEFPRLCGSGHFAGAAQF